MVRRSVLLKISANQVARNSGAAAKFNEKPPFTGHELFDNAWACLTILELALHPKIVVTIFREPNRLSGGWLLTTINYEEELRCVEVFAAPIDLEMGRGPCRERGC